MKIVKKVEIIPVFLKGEEYMPKKEDMQVNHLYISEHFDIAIHLCLCGCGEQCVVGLVLPDGHGLIKEPSGKISFVHSFGNWSGQNPYHAHYVITNNIANFC